MAVRSSDALRITALVAGLILALLFIWVARDVFLTAFLGVLLGLGVARPVDWLEQRRVPRPLGAALTMLTGLGVIALLIALMAPSVRDQSREMSRELPKAVESIDRWLNPGSAGSAAPAPQPKPQPQPPGAQKQKGKGGEAAEKAGLRQRLGKELQKHGSLLFPFLSSVFGTVAGLLVVLFIALYTAADPSLYRDGLLKLVPRKKRPRAAEVLSELADTLRGWLVARLIAMVVIGVVTALALSALRLKGAVALGALAGLMEFIPFFGPIFSAIPAIGVAFVESPQKAAWVLGVYAVIQQLEGNVLTPVLLKKRLDIPPLLTIVGVGALGVTFGVVGMLVAEPLVAVAMVLTNALYVEENGSE